MVVKKTDNMGGKASASKRKATTQLTSHKQLPIELNAFINASEALSNIAESIDAPLLVVDKDLRLQFHNTTAEILFSLDHNSVQEVITNIATQIDIADMRKNVLDVMKSGEVFSRQLDGEGVSYLERISPYRDANNNMIGAVLIYSDNTVARNAKRALEQSQERYDLALQGFGSGVWDWDLETGDMFWSPVLCDMLEIKQSKKRYQLKDLRDRIHPDNQEDVLAILGAHLERGFDFNDVECRLLRDDGNYIWVSMSGKAVWDASSKPTRMAGSVNDISDRRQAIEQLTDSNESLTRFAYVCSHDLKEPVRLIENFLSLYMSKYGDEMEEEGALYMEHVINSSQRIQQMICDILTYSQLENRGSKYQLVDCNEEIEKVLENLALTVDEKKAAINIATLPTLKGDRIQIFQIFQNLLSNSLKFCQNHAPVIDISAQEREDEWVFAVKDNGIGMKQEHASKIFGVFQRLNSQDEYPGTGVGLSICQRSVQKHMGKIWVESSPGEGATFYFTIAKNLRKKGRSYVQSTQKTG